MDWKSIIRVILPLIIAQRAPKFAPLIPVIIHGIEEAEDLKHASGKDKLSHAVELTKTAAEGINIIKDKEIINIGDLTAASTDAINTAVSIANLVTKH